MTDEIEEGPDPNDVRRHAKRMHTEAEYRRKYRRIDFYRPNLKQAEWHNLTGVDEKMLRAGNQQGKTHAGAFESASHAISLYPGWWKGRRFVDAPARVERPYEFIGWAGCTTSGKTRDGVQLKLLGDVRAQGGLGTGMIPLDNIVGRPTMARGIADFVDTVSLRRETGGAGVIRFKTFEMGRAAWQGEPVDVIWGDEDPDETGADVGEVPGEIYSECQARLTTTNGMIIWTMTPMVGLSPIRRYFKGRPPHTAEILMTIHDAAVSCGGHIPDDKIPVIIARYGKKAATRAFGADAMGQGSVFEVEPTEIKEVRDWTEFPTYWPWLWAVDFRHSGSVTSGHPFAAVLAAWDRDNDVIHLVHTVRMHGLAPMHVAAMREHPLRLAPVAWPHDGGKGAGIVTGETIAATYKKLGLNMRPTHATFVDGGFGFEAGITEMEERLGSGRLRVAAHLHQWLDEYQGYHRVNGLVKKVDDDLLSATRVACMDIRHARVVDKFAPPRGTGAAGSRSQIADGVDFDVHAPA
jgi:phage terminase large subunit-like protein